MMPGAPIRRCPECGEEFQPHVVSCSDCGAPLENAFEAEEPPADERGGLATVALDYVGLVSGLDTEAAAMSAERLRAAGIPFQLVSHSRRGLRLFVARDRVADAIAVLDAGSQVAATPDRAEGAVAVEGGPCPACGEGVAAGAVECPGCGLSLGGAAPSCSDCGAELVPGFDACAACGQEQR